MPPGGSAGRSASYIIGVIRERHASRKLSQVSSRAITPRLATNTIPRLPSIGNNTALQARCGGSGNVTASSDTLHGVVGIRRHDLGYPDAGSGSSEIIAADLVVDASGRGALTLALLDALDWQRPEVTEVGVDISYASAMVEIPPGSPSDWKLAVTFPDPPHLAWGAVLLPIEGNRR